MTKRISALAGGALCLLGCSPLPEADTQGRRVQVGSDIVDQICGGTVARLDAEVDTIEDRLRLAHDRDRFDVLVVADDVYQDHCGDDSRGCFQGPADRVLLRPDTFESSAAHELTHAVVWRQPAAWAPSFFAEGLAVALAPPSCDQVDIDSLPDIDEMLVSGQRYATGAERNYVAGQLVARLLAIHGPTKVLAFMGALRRMQQPNSIRKVYLETFGTHLDEDIQARLQADASLIAPEFGYLAPAAGPEHDIARFSLSASLDCDSPRVLNDFEQPGFGRVEWTIVIHDPSHSGSWRIIGEVPEGTRLEYQWASCKSLSYPIDSWLEFDPDRVGYLNAGQIQRMRWTGPLGSPPLSIELQGPCDPGRQNCPSGLVCSQAGDCRPLVDTPAGLGEPCEEKSHPEPLACEPGLVCIGDRAVDGSPEGSCSAGCAFESLSCPLETVCNPTWQFCAPPCDPLEQDCEAGHACDPSERVCVPSKHLDAGEPCHVSKSWERGFECAPGLVCERFPECGSDYASLGCCVPICDPSAPSCPADLSQCEEGWFGDVGVCVP